MATLHWAKGVDGSFTDNMKWKSGSAPTAGDDAVLDAPGHYTVSVSGSASALSIQTIAGVTLQINGGSRFTASAGTGAGANARLINIASGATMSVAGNIDNSGIIALGATTHQLALLAIGGDTTTLGWRDDLVQYEQGQFHRWSGGESRDQTHQY